MDKKGMLIIISGPSGSGKGTVVRHLDPAKGYALSISCTTRSIRPNEVDGRDYFFCSKEEFFEKRDRHELMEHALYGDHYYGTPRSYVEEQIEKGKTVVLEIEVNGALQVKEKFPDAVLVFLLPPSMAELKKRLISRNTEDSRQIEDRIRKAKDEIKLIDRYDYLVVNDTVARAVSDIDTIVLSEALKPCRNQKTILKFKQEMTKC